ncbi:hypothetical protein Pcinc_001691 [Petrolisthes cinctipes]|uniref:Transposase n=1 Tax=Petrolisthes cinctipes TaxID=88211 RepID=A0AAE1L5U7_PETCI|nr:hypothetical protein Pcinc_001691 [Petrolisthes cinctipes]
MIDMAINQAWLLYQRDYETKRIPQEKRHPLLSFRMAVSESLIRTGKIVKRGRPSSNEKTADPPKKRRQQMSQVRPLMDVRLDKVGHFPEVKNPRLYCKRLGCKGRTNIRANNPAREIAGRLNIQIRSVYRWITLNERRGNIENIPRCGAPRRTSREDDDIIVATARRQPLSNAVAMRQMTGIQVGIQTYRKRLHKAGIHHLRPATKVMLTEKHKEERLGFALQYYPMDFSFWSSVIFCDEKTFSSDGHGELHCWRPNNTRFEAKNIQPTRSSGRITAGLWGWMAACGPGELVVIDERLNSLQYIEILEQIMIPSVRALLIPEPNPIYIAMDDSTVHNAAIVTDWFQRHSEVIRIQWPARSPDLMPIENLWSQMVKKWDSNSAKTKVNLVAHAMNIWEAMRLKRGVENICETLVRSMSRRLNSVIECNGSYTKY